ncbi:hypothetical protein BJ742DRAFT_230432 [Cladochytrium replicatum]|nr:hypothetical protein BJ742DRAFT_230432 [Cladochytrium replicatum]
MLAQPIATAAEAEEVLRPESVTSQEAEVSIEEPEKESADEENGADNSGNPQFVSTTASTAASTSSTGSFGNENNPKSGFRRKYSSHRLMGTYYPNPNQGHYPFGYPNAQSPNGQGYPAQIPTPPSYSYMTPNGYISPGIDMPPSPIQLSMLPPLSPDLHPMGTNAPPPYQLIPTAFSPYMAAVTTSPTLSMHPMQLSPTFTPAASPVPPADPSQPQQSQQAQPQQLTLSIGGIQQPFGAIPGAMAPTSPMSAPGSPTGGHFIAAPYPAMGYYPSTQQFPTAAICRYFNQGRCWAGPHCRFSHIVNNGSFVAVYPTMATTSPSRRHSFGGGAFAAQPNAPNGTIVITSNPANGAPAGMMHTLPRSANLPPLQPNAGSPTTGYMSPPAPSSPSASSAVPPTITGPSGKPICRYYGQGKCWAGVHCRFEHPQ